MDFITCQAKPGTGRSMRARTSYVLIGSVYCFFSILSGTTRAVGIDNTFYVPNALEACVSSSVSLTGSENAEKIFGYLLSVGFTAIQTAGIMGNIQAESGFDPGIEERVPNVNNQRGYGIVQWTAGRRDKLFAEAAAKNVPVNDLGFQLQYLWQDLNDGYKNSTLIPIKATNDIREATRIFLQKFEIPVDNEKDYKINERTAYSTAILAQYGSLAPSDVGVATSSCGSSGGTSPPTSGPAMPSDPAYSTSSTACAAGTTDIGEDEGWDNGSKVTIRLCQIPGFVSRGEDDKARGGTVTVNAGVSGAVFAMYSDMVGAGIKPVAESSFRSMALQQKLYNRCGTSEKPNCKKGTDVAVPGESNHQMGLALDFDVNCGITGGSCQSSGARRTNPGNPTWDWLEANASSKYGYNQLINEAWHWSPDGK